MNIAEALDRAEAWRKNPRLRPTTDVAISVSTALAARVHQLEQRLRLAVGCEVLIERGNPDRGPETGPGFGRRVPAVIEEAVVGIGDQVRCRLLMDDPDAVGSPNRAGDSGVWALSQIVLTTNNST